jgi:hypothetical protein
MTAQRHGYSTPRYLTFNQAQELGGSVRKGEHGTKVYFVKQLQVRDRSEPEGNISVRQSDMSPDPSLPQARSPLPAVQNLAGPAARDVLLH